MQTEDENKIREIVWDLIIERVLTIGDYHNDSWPWLSLTEYGKKYIGSEYPLPNDITGYFTRLTNEIPQIDLVIKTYLEESIRTYNINQLMSSTITLGCASEKALLLLIESYQTSFTDEAKKASFLKKIENKSIKVKFDEFDKSINQILASLPYGLREYYSRNLGGIFEMIRNNRNDAGHPTGKSIDKDTLFVSLQLFIPNCKYVYTLITHFNQNNHN